MPILLTLSVLVLALWAPQTAVSVRFSWDLIDSHAGATFEVEYDPDGATGPAPPSTIPCTGLTVLPTERQCVATIPAPGTYAFRLRGTNAVGSGAWSASIVETVGTTTGQAPGPFTITFHKELVVSSRLFNGTTDKLQTSGDVPEVDSLSKFSVSAWIRPTNITSGNRHIVNKQGTAFNSSWSLQSSGGGEPGNAGILFAVHDAVNPNYGITPAVLVAGTPLHVLAVFDGTLTGNTNRLKIYVNGTLQTLVFTNTIPATLPNNSELITFGFSPGTDSEWLGEIAEVAMWNDALTQTHATALAAKDSPYTILTSTARIGYWRLKATDSPEPSLWLNYPLTVTGTTQSAWDPGVDDPPAASKMFPTSVIASGSWEAVNAASIVAALSDDPIDETKYARSSSGEASDTLQLGFGSLLNPSGTVKIFARIRKGSS